MRRIAGKKLQFFDPELKENYTPYVVETSIGLDRMFLAVFSNSLQEETLEDGSTRTVLRLPAILAPVKIAVFPLIKRDGLPELAKQIIEDLQWDYNVFYDEKDAVGKRYRRQDANGTPFCVTVDHQTLEDKTVTIRSQGYHGAGAYCYFSYFRFGIQELVHERLAAINTRLVAYKKPNDSVIGVFYCSEI